MNKLALLFAVLVGAAVFIVAFSLVNPRGFAPIVEAVTGGFNVSAVTGQFGNFTSGVANSFTQNPLPSIGSVVALGTGAVAVAKTVSSKLGEAKQQLNQAEGVIQQGREMQNQLFTEVEQAKAEVGKITEVKTQLETEKTELTELVNSKDAEIVSLQNQLKLAQDQVSALTMRKGAYDSVKEEILEEIGARKGYG